MATTPTHHHILIVDDEPGIRTVVRAALESDGYRVTEAANGAEAIRLTDATAFDAVLLDFNMPLVDGASVMESLARRDHRPPVVVMTAYGSVALAARMMKLGAADFLEKPLTPGELLAAIANAVSGERTDDAPEPAAGMPDLGQVTPARMLRAVRQALAADRIGEAEVTLRGLSDFAPAAAARPQYLNLKGIIQELRGRLVAAHALYRMAISADAARLYLPPVQNAWRLYDAISGRPQVDAVVALGDDAELADAYGDSALQPDGVIQRLKRRRLGRTFTLTPPLVPRPARDQPGESE